MRFWTVPQGAITVAFSGFLLGSLVDRCVRDGQVQILVATGDSDLLQLVQPGVKLVLPGTMRIVRSIGSSARSGRTCSTWRSS